MVDVHALSSRLSALENYLTELKAFRRVSEAKYVAQPALHHLAERYLHLACECVLDAAQHVISEKGFRQPTNYKEVMEVLGEEGVLEPDLAERLQEWMSFRNVLVHLYLKIDHHQTYAAIRDDLEDLEAFLARMSRFLEV